MEEVKKATGHRFLRIHRLTARKNQVKEAAEKGRGWNIQERNH